MKKIIAAIPLLLAFLLTIVLSIKCMREPDIWWQIRTGQWILELHQVPTTDPFSYTFFGKDWINIKWGFEVLAALIAKYLGPESIFILQIIASCLILWLFIRILKLNNHYHPVVFLIGTIVLLFGIEYRMNGRPEMFSHLFMVAFLYLLLLYHQSSSKWVWLVVPIQLLWTNLHEAYGLGIVILLLFTLGSWLENYKENKAKAIQLSLVTLASIIAIILNPRGIILLLQPLNIFNQVQQNKFTTELDAIWTSNYWQKEAWVLIVCIALLVIYLFKTKKLKSALKELGLGYFITLLAMLFLGFTAYRNIIFFLLFAFPLLIITLYHFIPKDSKMQTIAIGIGFLFYLSIVSNVYYNKFRPRDHYGLEVLSINNPSGAAQYITQKKLQSKKCFSDYLTSSYLLWYLQPDFKTYIDLRDLDVFPTSFFNQYLQESEIPDKFHALDLKEKFDYVVLFRNNHPNLHAYLYNDSIYACTYIDAVAAVYEKTDEFTRDDIFTPCKPIESSAFAITLSTLFKPTYTTYDYDALNTDFEAAAYYLTVFQPSKAEKRINQYLALYPDNTQAQNIKNQIIDLKSRNKN